MERDRLILYVCIVVFMIALIIVVAIVAARYTKTPCPPAILVAPVLVDWTDVSLNSVWGETVYYRCALFNPSLGTSGPWSPASGPVQSTVASAPMLRIAPQPPYVVIWQRKVLNMDKHWQTAMMTPVDQAGVASVLPLVRSQVDLWVDNNNPTPLPPTPVIAPLPAVLGANYFDGSGTTWLTEGNASAMPITYCYRYVGAGSSPWSAWSEQTWTSDQYSTPVLQAPVNPPCAIQWTGSWVNVGSSNDSYNMEIISENKTHSAAGHLRHGRISLQEVLLVLSKVASKGFGVSVLFKFNSQNVVAIDLAAQVPTRLYLFSHGERSIFPTLGFAAPTEVSVEGTAASMHPRFFYDPQPTDDATGMFWDKITC